MDAAEQNGYKSRYTIEDIYSLPEGKRAELIDGELYLMAAPGMMQIYVEPDISVICDPKKLTDRGCTGAPDWIIEIVSPSTASHDYIRKLKLYADAGVKEYWIVDPDKKSVYVYHLEEDKFEVTTFTFQDKIKANIYEDLWIAFTELPT